MFRNLASAAAGEGNIQCAAEGACAVAVDALRRHSRVQSVAAAACGAIANLANSREGKAALARAGALQCLISLLKTYEEDAGVAMRACAALGNWVAGVTHDAELSRAAASELAKAGAAPVLVSVLRRHVTDQRCAMAACRALQVMASDAVAREAIVGRLPAAGAAAACGAAGGAGGGAGGKSSKSGSIGAKGGPGAAASGCLAVLAPLISAAIKAHADDPEVVVTACRVIANLTLIPSCAAAISDTLLRSGVVATIATALRAHPRHEDIGFVACSILAAVTLDDASRAALVKAGAMAAVVSVVPYHKGGEGSEDLVPLLTLALRNLTGSGARVKEE